MLAMLIIHVEGGDVNFIDSERLELMQTFEWTAEERANFAVIFS
jgi:hypothetical protein|tara:strand:- start:538 stop:669 length:132 start_codon:yes stop_codon:yes gene_type:complete